MNKIIDWNSLLTVREMFDVYEGHSLLKVIDGYKQQQKDVVTRRILAYKFDD